jgi:hypothetical protein
MSLNETLIDLAVAKSKAIIDQTSKAAIQSKMARIAFACEQMLRKGKEINLTEIEKFTRESKDFNKHIARSTLYNDSLKTGKQHYVELLKIFQNTCPFHSSKSKTNSKNGNAEEVDVEGLWVMINNLKNRNEMLQNALDKQFKIQIGKSDISIHSLVAQGSSGDDSVDIKSQESRISSSQRDIIRRILLLLHEKAPKIEVKGDGDNQRLFDNETQMNILNRHEYADLTYLIEKV